MFKQLKDHFNCGAAGINVSCANCNETNFVSTTAMSAKHICRHCGKTFELSKQNEAYLRAMIALFKKMG